ncbi:Hypothetical protein oxidoreductase molybdopterin-binding domain protein [Thermococcus paralvinellae]|uniref:Oxidoreductase molybdopterin-binding domain-containing protein n=1 Tax=Thermococcus paralvinellae TaxID=582419 RepID=W0I0G0_9EURY|nr:Hypothetical protein oxidoreductase molybdopterin-binding domain protein [Thermococcus paralvinellae]
MKRFGIALLVLLVFICGCISQETATSPTISSVSSTTASIHSSTTSATQQETFAIEISGLATGRITLEELEALGGVKFNATLVKSTGAKINNTYIGVPLAKVFEKVGVDKSKVKWVKFIAEDGYDVTLSMEDLKNGYLCWWENGELLGPDNGGPVKLVIPDQPGKLWVKWLKEIRLIGDENAVVIHGKTKVTVVVTKEDIEELMKSFGETVTVELKGKNVTFSGIPLKLLLDNARPEDDATKVTFIAKDGYSATLEFEKVYENDKAILTTEFRVVIPGEPTKTWVKDLKEIVIG